MSGFSHELWSKEILRAYTNASALFLTRSSYGLPPLTRWQRIKRFLKFYEARRRLRDAWQVLRHGREIYE